MAILHFHMQEIKPLLYRIVPIKGASPYKGAPYGLRKAQTDKNFQNCPKIIDNCPIFNLKPPLESSEHQHLGEQIRSDLASAPCALIRDNTVFTHKKAHPYL